MHKYEGHSEKELIELLKQDDQDALGGLYLMHIRELKFFVLKAAKSPALAQDVLQDTFVRVWDSRSQIDPEQPFKPYLYTIAQRLLFTLWKRAAKEASIVAEIGKYSLEADQTTELLLEYNESNSLLNEAIASLPSQCREVFVRCKIQGMSHKQVAAELGIAESTVNNHMGKALRDIREFMNIRNTLAVIFALLIR